MKHKLLILTRNPVAKVGIAYTFLPFLDNTLPLCLPELLT